MKKSKLMLVDGNSILNRAFYGLQGSQLLATSYGLYTNAVYGFINILLKYLDEETPEYLCVAFDMKDPTFRHEQYDGYKANRKGMPEELAVQMPVIKEVLDAMNITRVEYSGYEADDLIGWLTSCGEEKDLEVVIVTGDRDSLQLISENTRVKLPSTRFGKTNTEEYDYNSFYEKYGITPTQFIDVKGLMGDPSDNIPGVKGIGEKTALKLIKEFGSIEEIYNDIDKVEKKGIKEKLEAGKDLAFLSKQLATIERKIPVDLCTVENLKIVEYDTQKLYQLFNKLEFKSLIEKLNLSDTSSNKDIEDSSFQINEIIKSIFVIKNTKDLSELKNKLVLSKEISIFHIMENSREKDELVGKLVSLSITWEEDDKLKSAYLDFVNYSYEDEFIRDFKDLFSSEIIKKVGHNIKNFLIYLMCKDVYMKNLNFDTMIAAYILNPSKETYQVSELIEDYLNNKLPNVDDMLGKGRNKISYVDIPSSELAAITAGYSQAMFELKDVLDNQIKINQQEILYYEIELPLIEVLANMEYLGFKVNKDELQSYSVELDQKVEKLTSEIYNLAGEEFNINSPKQLGVILFDKLRLPVIKKTKTGYSTNAEVLEQLAPMHEIVSYILEYRQLMKLKSTYVDGLINVINEKTEKIHSSFNQTVVVTGRISSTEPNLQNIPIKLEMGRKIRKVFVPSSKDYLFIDADYSQIELRVLAHISEDENFIAAFKNNEDIHASTAAKVFGVPIEGVTSLMRARAKAINFGIIYGIGEFSLAKDLGVTRKQAKAYIDEYLDKYSGVREYMKNIVEEGQEKGYVSTLFNRRRYLPELKSKNFNIRSFGQRVALNAPIQGTAADIIKIAMVKVYHQLKEQKMKSRLILQVHDELLIETHKDEQEEVKRLLRDCMEKAAKFKVPLKVDIGMGENWYDTK